MTFIFPDRWSNGKETFYVDAETCQQLTVRVDQGRINISDAVVSKKTNPFPGILSRIRFPARVNKALWSIRASFKKHWVLRCVLHGKQFSCSICPDYLLLVLNFLFWFNFHCYILVLISTRSCQRKAQRRLERYDRLHHRLCRHSLLQRS